MKSKSFFIICPTLSDLTIFIISSISPFETGNAAAPVSTIFFWIAASVAAADAVNYIRIKTLLANGEVMVMVNQLPLMD